MNEKASRALVAIYIDPDFYPPTINAIINLAEDYEEVVVISRNNSVEDYSYPVNVFQKKIGRVCTVREMEQQSVWIKAFCFLRFAFCLLQYSRKSKTRLVLLYDSIALYGFYLIKNLIHHKKKKIWYHNHDMPDERLKNQFTVGGLAAKYESKAMRFINFFSLPSEERSTFYTLLPKDIPVFIIPNYPSVKVYKSVQQRVSSNYKLRIIFQGFIGPGLALENMIELLQKRVEGKTLELILKGSVKNEYKEKLKTLAKQFNVTDRIIWIPIGPYSQMVDLSSSCDIGIGINMNRDLISKTLGTASNKIYEYAASGLPVLLFDNNHYRKYLDKYKWTFFTNGSLNSLEENIKIILSNDLSALKKFARQDFEHSLNFETVFCPALRKVSNFGKQD